MAGINEEVVVDIIINANEGIATLEDVQKLWEEYKAVVGEANATQKDFIDWARDLNKQLGTEGLELGKLTKLIKKHADSLDAATVATEATTTATEALSGAFDVAGASAAGFSDEIIAAAQNTERLNNILSLGIDAASPFEAEIVACARAFGTMGAAATEAAGEIDTLTEAERASAAAADEAAAAAARLKIAQEAVGQSAAINAFKYKFANSQLSGTYQTLSNLESVGSPAILKAATWGALGAGGIAYEGIKKFMAFNAQMTQVVTQAGRPLSELPALSKIAENVSKTTGANLTDVSNIIYRLASGTASWNKGLGSTTKQLGALTDATAKLNILGGVPSGAASEQSARIITAIANSNMRGIGQDPTKIAENINAAVGTGDIRQNEMITALGRGAPSVARALGVSGQDLLSLITAYTAVGFTGSTAGTYAKTFLTQLGGNGTQASKAFSMIGIPFGKIQSLMSGPGGLNSAVSYLNNQMQKFDPLATFQKFKGATGRAGALKQLEQWGGGSITQKFISDWSSGNLTPEEKRMANDLIVTKAFGGARGFAAIETILQNPTVLQGNLDHIQQNANANVYNKDVNLALNTPEQRYRKALAAMNVDLIQIGQKLTPYFEKFVAALGNVVNYLTQHGAILKALVAGLAAVMGVAAVSKMAGFAKDLYPIIGKGYMIRNRAFGKYKNGEFVPNALGGKFGNTKFGKAFLGRGDKFIMHAEMRQIEAIEKNTKALLTLAGLTGKEIKAEERASMTGGGMGGGGGGGGGTGKKGFLKKLFGKGASEVEGDVVSAAEGDVAKVGEKAVGTIASDAVGGLAGAAEGAAADVGGGLLSTIGGAASSVLGGGGISGMLGGLAEGGVGELAGSALGIIGGPIGMAVGAALMPILAPLAGHALSSIGNFFFGGGGPKAGSTKGTGKVAGAVDVMNTGKNVAADMAKIKRLQDHMAKVGWNKKDADTLHRLQNDINFNRGIAHDPSSYVKSKYEKIMRAHSLEQRYQNDQNQLDKLSHVAQTRAVKARINELGKDQNQALYAERDFANKNPGLKSAFDKFKRAGGNIHDFLKQQVINPGVAFLGRNASYVRGFDPHYFDRAKIAGLAAEAEKKRANLKAGFGDILGSGLYVNTTKMRGRGGGIGYHTSELTTAQATARFDRLMRGAFATHAAAMGLEKIAQDPSKYGETSSETAAKEAHKLEQTSAKMQEAATKLAKKADLEKKSAGYLSDIKQILQDSATMAQQYGMTPAQYQAAMQAAFKGALTSLPSNLNVNGLPRA